MDKEVRGRRKEGEKGATATVEKKSTETEKECRREKEKKQKKVVEKYAMLFHGGGTAPMVPLISV